MIRRLRTFTLWTGTLLSLLIAAAFVVSGCLPPGHCPCGYDLHGNESGTCPECGQTFEPKGDAP